MKRLFCFKLGLVVALVLYFVSPLFASKSFDHIPWHRVLQMVVSPEGFVNYDWLTSDPSDLDRYLKQAEKISPKNHPEYFSTRNDELVYWLQVYNAMAMKNVLKFPGLKKTSDKKIRFFRWSKFDLGGEKYSLHSLENKVIREEYKDARVHFFLNCASYSCPPLSQEPLEADRLDKQLNQFARKFINDSRNVRFNPKTGILSLSKIFKWYEVDFLEAMRGVIGNDKVKLVSYINQFRSPKDKIPAGKVKKIRYLPYNWTVNDINNL